MSFVGNCGTFTRGYRAMVLDVEFLYHLLYLLICAMGLFVHEFFYSLLVSSKFLVLTDSCMVKLRRATSVLSCHHGALLVMVIGVFPVSQGHKLPQPPKRGTVTQHAYGTLYPLVVGDACSLNQELFPPHAPWWGVLFCFVLTFLDSASIYQGACF